MKKVLLLLLLITTIMKITKLSAYCFHNWSNEETISIQIYESKLSFIFYKQEMLNPLFPSVNLKAHHLLQPKGGIGCWNWKSIDKNNRKKEYYWVAYKGNTQLGKIVTLYGTATILGEGRFPIGGAINFSGYDENARAKFDIYFGPNPKSMPPWKYWKSPWKHKSKPWKTYKR